MRFATIAIVGRANVGKSTFLNAVLGEPLVIVSPFPQTTRDAILGVVHRKDAQLALLDTPGLHKPRSELGRRMNVSARDAAERADLLLFVSDQGTSPPPRGRRGPVVDPEDARLLAELPRRTPAVLCLNKVDRVRSKTRVLETLAAYGELRDFAALVPVSLRDPKDADRLLDVLAGLAPEGPAAYPEDTLTDRSSAFFAREYVRESVLEGARAEVPHAVAVSLDEYDDAGKVVRIRATLHVDKPGQRKILVGAGGASIKAIGTRARHRIAELVGRPVHLELFVRVTPRWRDAPRQLNELGYALGDRTEPSKTTGRPGARAR